MIAALATVVMKSRRLMYRNPQVPYPYNNSMLSADLVLAAALSAGPVRWLWARTGTADQKGSKETFVDTHPPVEWLHRTREAMTTSRTQLMKESTAGLRVLFLTKTISADTRGPTGLIGSTRKAAWPAFSLATEIGRMPTNSPLATND